MSEPHFPNDENGWMLRSFVTQGVDLSVEHRVDFHHVLPSEEEAKEFADALDGKGYEIDVHAPSDEDIEHGDEGWTVTCAKTMIPTHEDISAIQDELGKLAQVHGGSSDGWGLV